ncbi:MAG TPA: sigma 54-interacting transcriptional regulator [Pyrinomonadaceae bacterium]|nr:sigma 54-interacting transcriptional regulator [Pyrinomonadaceae bacterium]
MTAKLKIISEKGSGEVFELNAEKISVGREAANEIVLNDASVSRRHCVIERRGEKFFVSDSGSLNGTSVNGLEAAETELSSGDKISVGDFTFRFSMEDSAEESSGVFLDKTRFRLPKNSVQLRLEEVFGAMARDLTAILQILTKINRVRDTETLQKELLCQIFEVVPADEGAILLVDDENQFAEIVGLNSLNEGEPVSVSQTVVGQVLQTKQVILVTDFEREENLQNAESLFLRKISSLLCAPVVLFEKTLGVIYLASSRSNFDESHLRFLTAVAGIAAISIENTRNFAFLENENARLRGETLNRNMLGESPAMQKVFELIKKVAPTDSTVLINGESGTGKELAAQAIHLGSQRSGAPFVAINCAALTETLLESELFGHEKGAFTGAVSQKKGKIETAQGGTLFLDEIGEMNINLQAKLLRVLQEREFERVGGVRSVKADIRLIAATNRDLQTEVKNGNFRQDLFYRLNVVRFTMPALRERREDILLLAENFAAKFSRILNRKIRGISANAKKLLLKYDFPGNVRELENALERAAVLGSSEWILPEDLPEDFLELQTETEISDVSTYHEALREKKKELILNAFREARGNYVETAKILDVHPNYLHRLIRNLEIKEELES